jgi:hypothetical protein
MKDKTKRGVRINIVFVVRHKLTTLSKVEGCS